MLVRSATSVCGRLLDRRRVSDLIFFVHFLMFEVVFWCESNRLLLN